MAIRYGTLNGGGGANLWRFISQGTDIELNTAAGVSGIRADNPADARYKLIHSEFIPGMVGSAFICLDGAKLLVSGASNGGGFDSAATLAQRLDTNSIGGIVVDFDPLTNEPRITIRVNDGASNTTRIKSEYTLGQVVTTIRNLIAGNSLDNFQTADAKEYIIYAGANVYRLRFDAQGFALYGNAGADLLLQITETGEILTNQTQAATGLDNTVVGRLPVHDESGILIGYAPLMVDP